MRAFIHRVQTCSLWSSYSHGEEFFESSLQYKLAIALHFKGLVLLMRGYINQ